MKDALDVVMAWQFRNSTQKLPENALNEVESLKTALVDHILKNVVRPLFDKSQHHKVTSEGRKASQLKRQKHDRTDLESNTKPWKFDHSYSIELLSWAIRKSDVRTLLSYFVMA